MATGQIIPDGEHMRRYPLHLQRQAQAGRIIRFRLEAKSLRRISKACSYRQAAADSSPNAWETLQRFKKPQGALVPQETVLRFRKG